MTTKVRGLINKLLGRAAAGEDDFVHPRIVTRGGKLFAQVTIGHVIAFTRLPDGFLEMAEDDQRRILSRAAHQNVERIRRRAS